MSDFSLQLTKNFSRIMRIRRQNLGWSAQDLTNKTEELGHKVSRSSLSGLENNRNKDRLNLPDALVIAEALQLPLRAMLFEDSRAMKVLETESENSKAILATALFDTVHTKIDSDTSTQKDLS